ncbi:MAG: hypothetical protein PHW52_04415, partial [Candidatus Pacebacteria bacterium]|nr:hypothetical protein [Candidatus Paceibacterota bacterium]
MIKIKKLVLNALIFLSFLSFGAVVNANYDSYAYKSGCGYNSVGPATNPANYDKCIHHALGSGSGSYCERTAASAGITAAGCGGWRISPVNVTNYDSANHTICKFACKSGNTADRNFAIGGSHTATCTSCASWSACSGGSQSCTSKSPSGCTGGSFATTRSCGNAGVCNNGCAFCCSYGTAISKYDLNPNYYWWCASPNGGSNSPQCSYKAS